MAYTIDAKNLYYQDLNELIRKAAGEGARHIVAKNVRGQRYLGAGLTETDLVLDIEGIPGEDLAFCLGGSTITARGHGQNAVANTMDSGTVIVHGLAGDALAYGMRGGKLFIRDNVGYRVGIHMKEYQGRSPAVVIGGTSGDFLGEYMAGGTIIVLNRNNEAENVAGLADKTLATGIHGGEIYIFNYELPPYMPGIGARWGQPSKADLKKISPLIEEFCSHFDLDSKTLVQREAVKISAAGSRPFSGFYFPAYPVHTGQVPSQQEMASPCEVACPVGIPTGRFLGHLRHGEYEEAFALIDDHTPFRYSNCGFICSHRCMEACSRGRVDFPVRTSELARNFHGNHNIKKTDREPGKIAVIGSGPAGLSSAYFLARRGYKVEVYEAENHPGGKMYQVISRERLPLEDLEKDLQNIKDLGIKFNLGQKINRDKFNQLVEENDHVIVAVGAHQPLMPPVEGRELIKGGLDFLKKFNLGEKIAIEPPVVVIGCGDAALDGLEALEKLGLEPGQITIIDIQAPSARADELKKWTTAGVKVIYPFFLEKVIEEGVYVRDSGGAITFLPGEPIAFINEVPKLDFLPPAFSKYLTSRGFFKSADLSGATENLKVSVTGDASGLGLVAESIRKGRECAERIHAGLQGQEYTILEKEPVNIFDLRLNAVTKCSGPEDIPVRDEHLRCLHCGVCVRCDACVEACPREARVRDGTSFSVALEKCGGCGSCAAACRGGVIRMVARDQF